MSEYPKFLKLTCTHMLRSTNILVFMIFTSALCVCKMAEGFTKDDKKKQTAKDDEKADVTKDVTKISSVYVLSIIIFIDILFICFPFYSICCSFCQFLSRKWNC